jgi:hypothetical protein
VQLHDDIFDQITNRAQHGSAALHREKVAGAGIARWMTQFAHRSGFDLSDALTSEIERFANFFEGARFTAVEAEAQRQDFTLARVEWGKKATDFLGQHCCCCNFEWRLHRAIFNDVAEFGIAVFAQRFTE